MPNSICRECPITERSPGTPPAVDPAPMNAWATYEIIGHGTAIVDVTYIGRDDLFTLTKVQIRNPHVTVQGVDPLYEAAYIEASRAAVAHGFRLDRFSLSA